MNFIIAILIFSASVNGMYYDGLRSQEFNPTITCIESACDSVRLTFTALGKNFDLSLVRNKDLVASTSINGMNRAEMDSFYQVRKPTGVGSLKIWQNKISGSFRDKDGEGFVIHNQGHHKIYKENPSRAGGFPCGSHDDHEPNYQPEVQPSEGNAPTGGDAPSGDVYRQDGGDEQPAVPQLPYRMDLLVITDSLVLINHFGNNKSSLMDFVLNHVNALNFPFNVYGFTVRLVSHVLWETAEEDVLFPNLSMFEHIKELERYASSYLDTVYAFNAVQLITGLPIPIPGSVGIAKKRSFCRPSPVVAASLFKFPVSADNYSGNAITSLSAHEMGHTIGLDDYAFDPRDPPGDRRDCFGNQCQGPRGECIMRYLIPFNAEPIWSNCAIRVVRDLDRRGVYNCSRTPPTLRPTQAPRTTEATAGSASDAQIGDRGGASGLASFFSTLGFAIGAVALLSLALLMFGAVFLFIHKKTAKNDRRAQPSQ